MICERARANLKAYCDGELDLFSCWRLRRHLSMCAACGEEMRSLVRLHTLLRGADLLPPDPAEAPGAAISRPGLPGVSLIAAAWRPALAGVALCAVIAGVLSWRGSRCDAPLSAALRAAQVAASASPGFAWEHCIRNTDEGVIRTWGRLPDALRTETRVRGQLTELRVERGGESWVYLPGRGVVVHSRASLAELPPAPTPLSLLEWLRTTGAGDLRVTEEHRGAPHGRRLRVITVRAGVGGSPAGCTLVLDTASGRLLRWRSQAGGVRQEATLGGAPPEALFAWRPPAGTRVVEVGDWWEERMRGRVAAARSRLWELIVHAVDVASNRDIWLTTSWQERGGRGDRETVPLGARLTDDRGRAYTRFYDWGPSPDRPHRAVIGYTPVTPSRPGEPPPRRLYADVRTQNGSRARPAPEADRSVVLPAPRPAAWTLPHLDPESVVRQLRGADPAEPLRRKARETYRRRPE